MSDIEILELKMEISKLKTKVSELKTEVSELKSCIFKVEKNTTNIESVLTNLNKICNKMDDHISFVDKVYMSARSPLEWMIDKIDYISTVKKEIGELPLLQIKDT